MEGELQLDTMTATKSYMYSPDNLVNDRNWEKREKSPFFPVSEFTENVSKYYSAELHNKVI